MSSKIVEFFKSHYVLIVFLVFIIIVVAWWKHELPSATWHYKITVILETPEGIKTGSAVRQIRQFTDLKIGDLGGGTARETGEAVVVDLGNLGKLFMTMGEDHYFLFRVFPFSKGGNTPEGIQYYSHLKNAKASILGLKNMKPFLVTFTDINNPLTVKAVEFSDLEKIFGKGVHVKDITIETTDEPITRGVVDNILPWLKALNGGYLDGKSLGGGPKLSNILYGGNFSR